VSLDHGDGLRRVAAERVNGQARKTAEVTTAKRSLQGGERWGGQGSVCIRDKVGGRGEADGAKAEWSGR
jgi:predicted homoserine dehydrogenase-like protein